MNVDLQIVHCVLCVFESFSYSSLNFCGKEVYCIEVARRRFAQDTLYITSVALMYM